jgi:Ni/Fe-hydrogenase 1 B-type cytochrome subunit
MGVSGLKTERHPLFHRILHEIMMASILFLIATGFYIHRPFVDGGGFLMSLTRGVHFFFAGILIIVFLLRVITMFIGPYRDWRSFIPTGYDFKLLPKFMLYYAHIGKQPETKKKYNALQMITYCGILLLVLFQIFSGFALLYPNSAAISWFNYGFFANAIETRLGHFIVTWAFLIFLMIHVYLGIRENIQEIKQIHLMRKEEETEEAA